jgi:hypothetical protein
MRIYMRRAWFERRVTSKVEIGFSGGEKTVE